MKEKAIKMHDAIDMRAATGLEFGRENIKDWLKTYTQIVGLVLILGLIYSIITRAWTWALILFCTLHLQIVFRYSFRTMVGEELWPISEEEPQQNMQPGLKAPPN